MKVITKVEYYGMLWVAAHNGTFPGCSASGYCMYRGVDGGKCAAGILIDDADYVPSMEGTIASLCRDYPTKIAVPEGLTLEDLMQVQRCHDNSVPSVGYSYQNSRCSRRWDRENFLYSISKLDFFKEFQRDYVENYQGAT